MKYSIELVKHITDLSKSGMSFVAHLKGERERYVVGVTNNGTDWDCEVVAKQLNSFNHLSSLGVEIDHTQDGLMVEVVTRFSDFMEAHRFACSTGKTTIYDSFRDRPIVVVEGKKD